MSRCHSTGSRLAVAAVAVLLAFGLGGRSAAAQSTAIDVQQFRPNPHMLGGFAVDSARVLPHLEWTGSLMGNYAYHPLRLVRGADNETAWQFVTEQATVDVMFAIGFFDFLDLSVDLPVTVGFAGSGLPPGGPATPGGGGLPSSGIGDLRLTPRAQFLNGLFGLGLAVDVFLPTGNDDAFLSDGKVRVAPRVAMHLDFDFLVVLLNVGLRFVEDSELFDLTAGHELFWGLGLVVPIVFNDDGEPPHALDIIGEMTSYTALDDPFGSPNETGLEMRLGARYRTPIGLGISLAGGPGIMPGYGTPDWRVIFGLQYTAPPCPAQKTCAELGCEPEPPPECDRDRDRICDPWVTEQNAWDLCGKFCKGNDECPDVPEDYDGWLDTDGCPEPDNDCDRICDPWVENANLDQMEHFHQYDGCGAKDGTCPAHALDSGAPCPSSDTRPVCRVREGTANILHDACPDRPETYNLNDDDDGCPDCTMFIPFEGKIEFEHAKWKMEDLTPESRQRLDKIVSELKDPKYSHIKRVRVEGHTSDMWNGKAWWGDKENLDLSRKRAQSTVQYLQTNGVTVELDSEGYGWRHAPAPPPGKGLEDGGRAGEVIKGDAEIDEWRDRSRRTEFRVIEWQTSAGCPSPCEACDQLRGAGEAEGPGAVKKPRPKRKPKPKTAP